MDREVVTVDQVLSACAGEQSSEDAESREWDRKLIEHGRLARRRSRPSGEHLLAEQRTCVHRFASIEASLFRRLVGDVEDAAGLFEHDVAVEHCGQEAVGHAASEVVVVENGLAGREGQLA